MSAILTSRVLPKISPSLLALAAAGDVRLASLKISGSLNTTFLGIMSEATTWAETASAYEAISTDRDEDARRLPWFLKMFSIPSLNLRTGAEKQVLTTGPSASFLTRQTTKQSMDFTSYDVKFGNDIREAYIAAGLPTNSNKILIDVVPDKYGPFQFILDALGYQPVTTGKMAIMTATNVGSSGTPPFTFAETSSFADGSYSPSSMMWYYIKQLQTSVNLAVPGQKFAQVYVYSSTGPEHRALFDYMTNSSGSPDWQYPLFFSMQIPYMDDGSYKVPMIFIADQKVYVHYVVDRRYGNGSSPNDIRTDLAGLNLMAPSGSIADLEGNLSAVENIPLTGYGDLAKGAFHFLPYLAPPLTDMNMILTSLTKEVETFKYTDPEGVTSDVEVDVYSCVTEAFCTHVTKAWYEEYQTTGFGLFTPRAAAKRDENIAAVNALPFDSLSICMDNANSVVSPDIVFQTDLAKTYIKAREKACKDNNWLDQKAVGDVTYRTVRNNISREPLVKAFYSVMSTTSAIDFEPVQEAASITWTFVNSEGNEDNVAPSNMARADSESGLIETYAINTTTRDLAMAEYGAGATLNIAVFKQVFAMSADDALALDGYQRDTQELSYADSSHQFNGVRLQHQYFTPELALTLGGYPLYRYMASPYKEMMIIRMYGDFKKMGDGFVRVIESFFGEVLIQKLLVE